MSAISGYINQRMGGLEHQDDAMLLFEYGDYLICAAVDGSSGGKGMVNTGAIASSIIEDWIHLHISETTPLNQIQNELPNLFYAISRTYLAISAIDERYQNICSSLSVLIIEKVSLLAVGASIGNTEIHLVRSGHHKRLTSPQSEAFDLLESGQITADELYQHPKRAILTSALGVFDDFRYDPVNEQLLQGDIVVLCSDGIFRVTSPEGIISELADLSQTGNTLEQCVNGVLDKAEGYEPNDNLTLGVLVVEDDGGLADEFQASSRFMTALNDSNNHPSTNKTPANSVTNPSPMKTPKTPEHTRTPSSVIQTTFTEYTPNQTQTTPVPAKPNRNPYPNPTKTRIRTPHQQSVQTPSAAGNSENVRDLPLIQNQPRNSYRMVKESLPPVEEKSGVGGGEISTAHSGSSFQQSGKISDFQQTNLQSDFGLSQGEKIQENTKNTTNQAKTSGKVGERSNRRKRSRNKQKQNRTNKNTPERV